MISRKIISFLIVSSSISCVAVAQENLRPPSSRTPSAAPIHVRSRAEVPITDLKFIGFGLTAAFGAGFCVDPQCCFIGTNFHVAETAHPRKIKGQKVVEGYLSAAMEADPNLPQRSLNRGRWAAKLRQSLIPRDELLGAQLRSRGDA